VWRKAKWNFVNNFDKESLNIRQNLSTCQKLQYAVFTLVFVLGFIRYFNVDIIKQKENRKKISYVIAVEHELQNLGGKK
jgi:hypothetical protein